MEVQSATLVRFGDRRSAYRFVSEMRRRYDLDNLAGVRVQPAGDDVVVEVPLDSWSNEVADVAERHGGKEPATNHEFERLRAAMETARQVEREARQRLAETRATIRNARQAMSRAEDRIDGGGIH